MKSAKHATVSSLQQHNHLALFDHLPRQTVPSYRESMNNEKVIHPATTKIAGLYFNGSIQEDDERVIALVVLLRRVIEDYQAPPKRSLREDLDKHVSKQVFIN